MLCAQERSSRVTLTMIHPHMSLDDLKTAKIADRMVRPGLIWPIYAWTINRKSIQVLVPHHFIISCTIVSIHASFFINCASKTTTHLLCIYKKALSWALSFLSHTVFDYSCCQSPRLRECLARRSLNLVDESQCMWSFMIASFFHCSPPFQNSRNEARDLYENTARHD